MHPIRATSLALIIAASAFAQTKQPITHEALFLMKRVGAPLPLRARASAYGALASGPSSALASSMCDGAGSGLTSA